jgi:hypothetical protein
LDLGIWFAESGEELEALAIGKAPGLLRRVREVFGELLAAGKFVELEEAE